MIDISGDGVNNDGRPPAAARDEAIAQGVSINGLVIMVDGQGPASRSPYEPPVDEFYRDNVIGGAGAFVIAIADPDAFACAVVAKIIREIAALAPGRTTAALGRNGIRIATPGQPFVTAALDATTAAQ